MKCNSCGTENVEGARFCASCGATIGELKAADNSLVGQLVGGRYNVKRVLGEGGMGIVYEAEQQMGTATRKVALKTLHQHLSRDPAVSARFHREVGTIAGLEHPNTIKVYDFGSTPDGTLYIAMEFVAGKSLSQVIEGGPMQPARALNIVRQISGSLQEAHTQGIIHRDLKPDNVVLTDRAGEKDVVKLLDFGIAARTESADAQREQKLTQQGMVLGTPPYMSPEQFTGKALDARSDIYSLGVMAYEMVTGRLPFAANTPWQWATEHMTAQPIPFEATPVSAQIPAAMRAGILRSLAKDKEQRQSTVKQFYEELAGDAAAPQPASGSTGTAQMPTPPSFAEAQAMGNAKTAAMPSTGSAVAVPAAQPSPALAPPKSGGKGLVFTLAGVGGVLLIGIVVIAARSMKPKAPDAVAAPVDVTPAPVTTVAAQPPEPAETAAPTAAPVAPATPPEHAPEHAGIAKAGTTTTTGSGTTGKAPPSASKDPCGACISAASGGNIAGAGASYGACTDAAQKSHCAQLIRAGAPGAAQEAAFNGRCPQAKAIAAVGQSVGVSARVFANALKACK